MKRIHLQELYATVAKARSDDERSLQLVVGFEFADRGNPEAMTPAFVEAAIQASVGSMHGTVGGLLFPLTLQSINPYNRTAKLQLGDIKMFDMLWTALTICEPVKNVRYKICLKELWLKEEEDKEIDKA